MKQFIAKYGDQVQGVVSGFDRLVFRGQLRALAYPEAMEKYLSRRKVLLKDFGRHVEQTSQKLKAASTAAAVGVGRYQYLNSTRVNKEEVALRIAREHGVTNGLVCSLGIVEPCFTFDVRLDQESGKLGVVGRERKCMHVYHYLIHPTFGWCSARIQTWFPFATQVCINGREWLSRQMDQAGLRYVRRDNCFPWIEDFDQAQVLMNEQLRTNWPQLLHAVAQQLNPLLGELFDGYPVRYYWSVYQGEWATDISFTHGAELKRLFPLFTEYAITSLGCHDILRFLGHGAPGRFEGEASSDLRRREEGVRIKHRMNGNSIKAYDKAYTEVGSTFRVETTINNADDFRVYRPKEGEPNGERTWRRLRKGVADVHRRAEVSQRANERYLDALAAVDDSTRLQQWTAALERRIKWGKQTVRALHPFSPEDHALLEAVAAGEFIINGLRNRDLQARLFPNPPADAAERRRRSACVSRKLRLLRAHGLLNKVAHTHRYVVTSPGRRIISAILTAQHTPVNYLTAKAA